MSAPALRPGAAPTDGPDPSTPTSQAARSTAATTVTAPDHRAADAAQSPAGPAGPAGLVAPKARGARDAPDPRTRPRGRHRPHLLRETARWTFLVAVGLFFLVPQLAMARFAFQNVPVALLDAETVWTGWSLARLGQALAEPGLWEAARVSGVLAVLSVGLNLVLLLPLAVLVEIRSPRLRPVLTAVTLLPWVIPPIALVVGVAATFRPVAPWFLSSTLSLVPFYALWAMPFTYRALDAGLRGINARTLVEAARGLGASLPTVILRVLAPNLGPSIVAASGLTAALVLGEFAFASLLLKQTLPTYLVTYQRSAPQAGMALALAVMVLTALLLWAVVHLLRRRGLGVVTSV